MNLRPTRLMAPLALVGLVACAQSPQVAAPEPVLTPNANLVVQGIPAIGQSLVDRVQKFTDFRGHGFVDWHPAQRQMLISHRKAGDALTQIYLLRSPMAEPE